MDKNATYRIGKQVLTEDDLKMTVEYKGEIFTMRYPNPLQRSMIESEISRRLSGSPRESFPTEHLATIVACSYIDNLIIPDESPKWFTSAWSCYDEELIGTLYAGYLRFRDSIQQKIREDGFARGSEGGSP